MDYYSLSLLIASLLTGVNCQQLTAAKTEEFSSEGSSVTLTCSYSKGSATYLFWYRQNPGKHPEFLKSHSPSGEAEHLDRMTFIGSKEEMSMTISSAAWIISVDLVSDLNSWNMLLHLLLFSLCIAMGSMNTVTQEQREHAASEGTPTSLSCDYTGSIYNVQWYRQRQRSRPEFLLSITESGSIHPTRSDFSAHIDKTQKQANLLISSAAVTDSAVYYCAVSPTDPSLLLADDVVLLAPSGRDPQLSPERFAAECEAAGMRIGGSDAAVWSRKRLLIVRPAALSPCRRRQEACDPSGSDGGAWPGFRSQQASRRRPQPPSAALACDAQRPHPVETESRRSSAANGKAEAGAHAVTSQPPQEVCSLSSQ
ncbi:uncharacterized protein LOC129352747 [Poeciliopsis prolifica]|uniref:uncharacterized protein LOC129352747 n=1 Tax=Poeciliopsis prolifica TaxID=188132 RepID=UPI0024145849|nr:uncharacterized protein LOC129352747 [Poeciliopsis prolifica]